MQPQRMSDLYHYLSRNTFNDVASYTFPVANDFSGNSSSFFPHVADDVIDHNTPEARAVAASQHHKEAERRRRERINSHLDRLRTLLPCNSKTDKASLLAKVVQKVKELKQETSEMMQMENFPSETDEISVLTNDNNNTNNYSSDRKILIKASLCCEDRSDLIPELIQVLKSVNLSPLRAEMVTMGGRIRNVIILGGDKDEILSNDSVPFLRDALRSLVHRSNNIYASNSSTDQIRPKRRRVIDEQRSCY